jgi:hypothetical protein
MWRRGAAEVVSLDLEDPSRQQWQGAPGTQGGGASTSGAWEGARGRTRQAFELAREALGAEVSRLDVSVYDLSPQVAGTFDFAFMGSLLLHLRDPVGALAAVREVVGGQFLLFEPVLLSLSLLFPRTPLASLWQLDEPRWWLPNRAGLRRLVQAAGFDVLEAGGPRAQRFGRGFPRRPPLRRPTLSELLFWTVVRPLGVPSAWVLAQPVPEGRTARTPAPSRVPLLGWV